MNIFSSSAPPNHWIEYDIIIDLIFLRFTAEHWHEHPWIYIRNRLECIRMPHWLWTGSLCTVTIPHGSAARVCAAEPGLCWFQFDSAPELNWSSPETAFLMGTNLFFSGELEGYCENGITESKEQFNPATNLATLNIITNHNWTSVCSIQMHGLITRSSYQILCSQCNEIAKQEPAFLQTPSGLTGCPHCGTSPRRRLALCMAIKSLEGKKGDGASVAWNCRELPTTIITYSTYMGVRLNSSWLFVPCSPQDLRRKKHKVMQLSASAWT